MAIADPSARHLSAASRVVVVGESHAPVVAVLVPAARWWTSARAVPSAYVVGRLWVGVARALPFFHARPWDSRGLPGPDP
jgi:hypothetical protein